MVIDGSDVYQCGFQGQFALYWKNGIGNYFPSYVNSQFIAYAMAVAGTDIYVAGVRDTINPLSHTESETPLFWKNNLLIPIETTTQGSRVTSIAVSGTDVYLAGTALVDSVETAVYWKNGKLISLTDGKTISYTSSIAVSGSDIYVSGTVYNGAIFNGNIIPTATYWKNGKATSLTAPNVGSTAGKLVLVN